MSQDVLADALNAMRNAKRARKENVRIGRVSKLLIEVLKIMKQTGAVKSIKLTLRTNLLRLLLVNFLNARL